MKRNLILSSIWIVFSTFILSSCDKNEPDIPLPSPRDGIYEGENLSVIIDGEPVTSIKSVNISSLKIPYAKVNAVGDNGSTGGNSLDVYNTSVIFTGFPGIKEELTLETVSTIYYFNGNFNIRATGGIQYYEFIGTFTGNPSSPNSDQGLILEFNSLEYPQ